ncbi:SigE family RNA polymerase sigma factor [Catellatospora sp. NEAU-YM18]|nr:SigE family RNA polymerase sigma factor [Catellatospora tritici]
MDRFDGFQEFVVARGGALSRTAFLLTGEHHAAEDLVQAALAKAAARWRRICAGGEPEAYVRRIMVNERISWWRRRPASPIPEVPDVAVPGHEQRIVDRIALGHALGRLSPRQRAAVVLRFYEDLSEAETASVIGCSVGAVKRNTHDALVRLREALPLYAEQAGQYADGPAAVAAARRRKVATIAGAAALILVPLLVAATLLWAGLPGRHPLPPSTSPSPSPTPLPPLPSLPTAVPDRRLQAAPLPAYEGIGQVRMSVGSYLVTEDGSWWKVPGASHGGFDLSPDGRWLVTRTEVGIVLRDLTGTAEHPILGAFAQILWSPSGNWMFAVPLAASSADGKLVSMGDLGVRGFGYEAVATAVAVLDSGELLLSSYHKGQPSTRLTLKVFTPATGAARELRVDATAHLGDHEDLALVTDNDDTGFVHLLTWGRRAVLARSGGIGAVVFFRRPAGENPDWYVGTEQAGVLEFSLADGQVLRRLDLPGVAGAVASPICYRGDELLWNDGAAIRRTPADSLPGTVVLRLTDGFDYRPPGCGAIFGILGSRLPSRG